MPTVAQAPVAILAEFPEKFFLENLAVRSDGSLLITAQNRKELWFVPPVTAQAPVQPAYLHTFEWNTLFVVEWRPDIFILGVGDVYESHEARIYAIDLRSWSPGEPISPRLVLDLPEPFSGLNGGTLIAPNVLLAAGMANVIWRIDLSDDGSAAARVWLQHDTLKNRPGEKKPEQPGVNGLQFAARSGFVYYTSTSQQLMMRVKVDPETLDPDDLPEFVAGGREWDDFFVDEELGFAYATTHRENTIDRVRLAHDGNREGRTTIVGDPFTDLVVGPSAGAWSRVPGEHGRIAYVTTDGGTAAPPDGRYRTAKLLRVDVGALEA